MCRTLEFGYIRIRLSLRPGESTTAIDDSSNENTDGIPFHYIAVDDC